jgi:urease accessory protein
MTNAEKRSGMTKALGLGIIVLLAGATTASAHEATGVAGGFTSGFLHPLLGWDHIAAMVAVGLWGAFLGTPAIWLLPIVFPLVMAVGAVFGITGVPLPAVEIGIAASALVLGIMVALAVRPPLWVAAIIVGAFAIFHGHAHGTELPGSANALAYAVGFVIATGLLHLFGILFGLFGKWEWGRLSVRAAGAAIAAMGAVFLASAA